jgi:hypothetical protein
MAAEREPARDSDRAKGGRLANAPIVLLGALFVLSLLTRCSGGIAVAPGSDAGASSGATAGASSGVSGGASSGASVETDASGLDSAANIECDGGDLATQCPFPPSTCSDEFTLEYYTSPSCVTGQCQWTSMSTHCSAGCMNWGNPVQGYCYTQSTSSGASYVPPTDDDSGANLLDAAVGATAPSDASGLTDGGASADAATPYVGTPNDAAPVACSDGSVCEVPPSICRDATHVAYFVNPRCVDGLCASDVQTLDCGASGCSNGGCVVNTTVPR